MQFQITTYKNGWRKFVVTLKSFWGNQKKRLQTCSFKKSWYYSKVTPTFIQPFLEHIWSNFFTFFSYMMKIFNLLFQDNFLQIHLSFLFRRSLSFSKNFLVFSIFSYFLSFWNCLSLFAFLCNFQIFLSFQKFSIVSFFWIYYLKNFKLFENFFFKLQHPWIRIFSNLKHQVFWDNNSLKLFHIKF